jgi:Zn-dependent protease
LLFSVIQAIQARDPVAVAAGLLAIAVVLLSVTTHESMHAFAADRLGDPTPRYQGRLTLNPLAHLDPIWTLMILVAGVGMGRPVQFNPLALRTDRRTGSAVVALAGPLTNIVLGVVFGLTLRLLLMLIPFTETSSVLYRLIVQTFGIIIVLNFGLAIFNMIPFPPLDGSKVLLALLPPDMAYRLENVYMQIGQYGLLLIFVILFLARDFISSLIFGPAQALFNLIVGTG